MKTIETKLNGKFEITNEQYQILSWYATISLNEDSDKKYWQLWGLRTAGEAALIPWQLFYDIDIEKRIRGYQNMNRLSEIKLFDYDLK